MMIHINLLPVRQEKKREVGRQFLVVVGGALFITLLGNWLWYDGLASEEKKNAQRMAATQARIAELEKVIGEVDKINARKKDVQAKLAILADLRKQRTGPVRMLDALSTAIPKKVWLTGFDEKSSAVKMTGRAVSHEDVAEFMRALQSIVWTPGEWGGSSSRSATRPPPGWNWWVARARSRTSPPSPSPTSSPAWTSRRPSRRRRNRAAAAPRHASWSSRST